MTEIAPLGVLGGTFDPIHLGHLRIAEGVAEALSLRRIYFVPANEPPHKDPSEIYARAEDRLEMVRLAVKSNKRFRASSYEVERGGTSYTIDTLRFFSKKTGRRKFYFIIGSDTVEELPTWKDFPEHFNYALFVTALRPGNEISEKTLESAFKGKDFSTGGNRLFYKGELALISLTVKTLNISSTEIREMIKRGESVRYLLPEEVWKYIKRKKLYV